MSTIPDNPNALLSREQTAKALTESGFQTEATTLATKATRGGGARRDGLWTSPARESGLAMVETPTHRRLDRRALPA
jgi:hypothetical protein